MLAKSKNGELNEDENEELLKLFDIPASMLPEVHPSSYHYGFTDETILGSHIPICGVVGDQQAALFGQLCVEKGSIKNTYGYDYCNCTYVCF